MQNNPTLCIFHADCPDGYGSAWAVWKRFGDAVHYFPATHGHAPPDVTDRHVVIVDFTYKAPVMRDMASKAASITVLDHHKSAEIDLAPLLADGTIAGLFDMNRSGAVIAWEYFHPDDPVPQLLLHVQDRDLSRFALANTREITTCVLSYPYNFYGWSWFAALCDSNRGIKDLITDGKAIERQRHKDITDFLKSNTRQMTIGGMTVPVANMPHNIASDAAHVLAANAPFGACYFDRADERVFSLRSRADGIDVSLIAGEYGGGGHQHASGFQMPHGWGGDHDEELVVPMLSV